MASWPGWYLPVAVIMGVLALSLFSVFWAFERLANQAEEQEHSEH